MSIRQFLQLITVMSLTSALILGVLFYAKYSQPSNASDYTQCIESTYLTAPSNESEKAQALFDNTATCESLKAQWASADTTHYAYWAGVVGIGLVFLTLAFTAGGVSIAKDTAQKQLKAFVSVTDIEMILSKEKDKCMAIIRYKNTGQTPAFSFMTTYKIGLFDPRIQNQFVIDPQETVGTKASQSYGAGVGGRSETFTMNLSKSQWIDLEKGYLAIFVFGVATYRDIYNSKRTTTFRQGWGSHFFNLGRPDFAICAEGNEMT